MKKAFLFFLAIVATTVYAGAQKKMINAAQDALEKLELDKAWESIQIAKNGDETKDNPKTYYVMGEILQAIGKFQAANKSTDPKYASISDNPVIEAYNYYQKALDIDPKKKYNNEISLKLPELTSLSAAKAISFYEAKNYDKALEHFELILNIEKNPIYKNMVDTSMIFNCGLSAVNAKKYDKAIEYLKRVAELKYGGGSTYSWLRSAYMLKGDTAEATATMQKAYEIYPSDLSVLVDLVNFYLTSGQINQAFDYLNKAKEKDPNNVSFIFAEGTLYEKMNKPDKAVESYNKALVVDPNYFNAYYNIGVIYHNKAKSLYDSANNENDMKKYGELVNRADEELKNSVVPLDKAHLIDPKETTTAETLKSIYVRLQMDDKLLALCEEMHKLLPQNESFAKTLKGLYEKLKMDGKLQELKTEMGWK